MKKTRIGIIGVGNISEIHIQSYLNDPRVELYAFCDIDPVILAQKGEKYGVKRLYTDLDEMLALPELEGVSVCTWNCAHAECTIKALRAGKHVLCEKPMALNTAQAEEMQRTAEETGKTLMIGFVRRFGADCAMLQEYKEADFLGDIYYAKVWNLRRHGDPGGWFGDKARSGGGPLIDLGVHVIDLMCYTMGNSIKPVSVYGAAFHKLGTRPNTKDKPAYISPSARPDDVCDVEDLATALIRFDNGAVLSVEVSFALNIPQETSGFSLYGTKGGITTAPEFTLSTDVNGRMANIRLCSPAEFDFKSFHDEISHFVDCIRDGVPCRNPGQDGVKLMKILDAIYASAASGHEVEIHW